MSKAGEATVTGVEGYVEFPIQDVEALHTSLKAIHSSQILQPLPHRLFLLKLLSHTISSSAHLITQAIALDLGRRDEESLMGEIWPVVDEINLAVKRLPEWMKDESAVRDTPWGFKMNKPRVRKQSRGVGLIIGPWNYPFLLNLGPLIGAIASGSPAIIKPSEHSPHSSILLSRLLTETFSNLPSFSQFPSQSPYQVLLGSSQLSQKLIELEWGHIVFTGSPGIGKLVAVAAARTLTPVTLELGGKSPVIVAGDADLKITARRVLSMKGLAGGQMCTNADYILVTRKNAAGLMNELEATLNQFYPSSSPTTSPLTTPDLSQMINHSNFDRVASFLKHLKEEGRTVLGGEMDRENRKITTAVVLIDPLQKGFEDKDGGEVMREEIFGPILPVVVVENIDEAIAYVNARPHPLALYVFSASRKVYNYVVDRTLSGGTCMNDISIQTITRSLPFGGVGNSGYGASHGRNYFDTFTHRRAMIEVPYNLEPIMSLRYPPFNPKSFRWLKLVVGKTPDFAKPTSAEAESFRLKVWPKVGVIMFALRLILMAFGVAGVVSAVKRSLF